MQELSANNENDWAEHLVGEMVEGAASFKNSQDAMQILKESLALSCFGEEFVGEQLKAGPNVLLGCFTLYCIFQQSPLSACACSVTHAGELVCSKHYHGLVILWLRARQHTQMLHAIA